jgi:aspartyl-tRNA(Asn)/glutamyl-tRNA(Gln) amidotransferase subunit A
VLPPYPRPAAGRGAAGPAPALSRPVARQVWAATGRGGQPLPTLAQAARDLAQGQTTSVALTSAALAAIAAHNATLNALVEVTGESALAAAAQMDKDLAAGIWRGPLHGIPITVKDIIDVAGVPTRAGSAAYEAVPVEDAAAVRRLRRGGAVVLGKAATHEFALGVCTPQSRNPHDPARIPGGSSGGSAIAVATGMGLASLGTDTRASIRVPAALSGVVGLKPTFGAVPTDGVLTLSWTMDHVAPIAGTVEDAAIVLDVLTGTGVAGGGLAAAVGRKVSGLRVGVPMAALDGAEPGVAAAFDQATKLLADLGCPVGEAARPTAADLDEANAVGLVVSRCEAAAAHRHLGTDLGLYWDEVADQLREAQQVSATEYLDAQRMRVLLRDRLAVVLAGHDVLALPTSLVVAPPTADFARYLTVLSRNAIPWSLVGFPALSVPCGAVDGLPVGLQLVAAPGGEERLVALGAALESAMTG